MKSERVRSIFKYINVPSSPIQATQVADFYLYIKIAMDSTNKKFLQADVWVLFFCLFPFLLLFHSCYFPIISFLIRRWPELSCAVNAAYAWPSPRPYRSVNTTLYHLFLSCSSSSVPLCWNTYTAQDLSPSCQGPHSLVCSVDYTDSSRSSVLFN